MTKLPIKKFKLRNGFYIKVCNKGSNFGVTLKRNSRKEMLRANEQYKESKKVIILGEFKNGHWINKKASVN